MRLGALLCLLVCVCGPGCAQRAGQNTTAAAIDTFGQKVAPAPGEKPAEAIAARAVKGALDELSDPAQSQRINEVVSGAADALQSTVTEGLEEDFGPEGKGPLGESVAATAERTSEQAIRGAMTTLLAACDPADPSCLDRRISDLSGRAGVAFANGIKRSIGVAALIVAFVAGAATVALVMAVWITLKGRKRSESGERRRHFKPNPQSSAPT